MFSLHGYYLQIPMCNVCYILLKWRAPLQKEKRRILYQKSLDHEDLNWYRDPHVCVLSLYALIYCPHNKEIPKSLGMIIDLQQCCCYQIIAVKALKALISVFYQDSAVLELFSCASEMLLFWYSKQVSIVSNSDADKSGQKTVSVIG